MVNQALDSTYTRPRIFPQKIKIVNFLLKPPTEVATGRVKVYVKEPNLHGKLGLKNLVEHLL